MKRMNKEELKKHVDLELQWLRYYANSETRNMFDPEMSPYDQLICIGYTKRVISLRKRCMFLRFKLEAAGEYIVDNSDGTYSALEVYLKKYPEEHTTIKNYLKD